MTTLSEIQLKLKALKPKLLQRYPIAQLGIFGSYARNEQTESSDLDLIVEFNGRIGSGFIDLADELERLLGMPVDLVSKKGIKEKYLRTLENEIIYV